MKSIMLTLLGAILSISINAQEIKNHKIGLAVYTGLNLNKTKLPDSFDKPNLSIGYLAGGYARYNFTGKLSATLGVHYILKGGVFESYDQGIATPWKLNLNYFELPLLIAYSVFEKLNIEIGPSFAYQISAVLVEDGNRSEIEDIYDDIDYGINIGASFKFSKHFSLFGRYYYGLHSLYTESFVDPNTNTDSELTIYNRNLLFGVSYKLL